MDGVWLLTVAALVGSCWNPLLVNAQGTWMTLNGETVPNNSNVDIQSIGTRNSALSCHTDFVACCRARDTSSTGIKGHWFFPNGSHISHFPIRPYYRTRHAQQIHLNRNRGVEMPIGTFHCEIPVSNSRVQKLYVNVQLDSPPSAVDVTSRSLNQTTLMITWVPDEMDIVSGFVVEVSYYGPCSGVDETYTLTFNGTRRRHIFTGLQMGSTYTVSVTAMNRVGNTTTEIFARSSGVFGIFFNGTNIGNNSLVNLTDVGIGTSSLQCITDFSYCHGRTNSSSVGVGNWYYPNGTQIPSAANNSGISDLPYYVRRGFQNVMLQRNRVSTTTGIFRCDIPDVNGTTQTFFVGIYNSSKELGYDGTAVAVDVRFNNTLATFDCISYAGPVTAVTWWKNGVVISLNETYQQSKVLLNATFGIYRITLNVTAEPAEIVGIYSCSVNNSRGRYHLSPRYTVLGLLIFGINKPLLVGERASIIGYTDLGAESMQWLDGSGNTIISSSYPGLAFSQLALTFNPVNESIRNERYTCRVTSPYGVQEEIITVNVTVPELIVPSISVEGMPIAGQQYSLKCNITKIRSGIINSSTAQWIDSNGQPVTSIDGSIRETTTKTNRSTIHTVTFSPLHTSHGGRYTCRGSAQSPLLVNDTTVSITQNVTVTIPAPSVRIEPPTFTGSNITLRCIITLNAAEDMGVTAGGVDVTWKGPHGNITSSSRIAISAVTGSSTMYESNLIFYALTLEDLGSYTCRASISPVGGSPYILMSGTGSDSETITLPVLRPSVSVVGTPIAGQRYSLNCNITDIRSALKSSFTAQWTERDGRPVTSTDSSIRETTTNTDRSTIHTITFSPLRTSHGRQYTCRGSATTPLLLRTTFHSIAWNVLVAISQPAVRIKPPIFTESNVTLRCIITLNAAVDTGTAASGVDVTWKGPHGAIASSSQIAISGVTGSGNIYESNLIFYTLTGEDTGSYTCRATVSAVSGSPYILRSRTGSDSETITVHGLIRPHISVEGMPIAGQQYSLNCSIIKVHRRFINSSTAQWIDANGQPVTSTDGSIRETTTNTNHTTIHTITFSPLRTSHGGRYTCRGSAQSPFLMRNNTVFIAQNVIVAISTPSVRLEPPIFTESNITLRCIITLNAAVDTGIAAGGVDVTWEGPHGAIASTSRIAISGVTGSSTMYESNLIFYALTMEDTGSYICRATISPVSGSPYILRSRTGSDSETITVQELIPSISVEGMPIAGQQYSLNCNITKIRSGLTNSFTAQWIDSNGQPVISTDGSIRETTTNTDRSTIHTITFSPLHTSHGGQYTCRGSAQSYLLVNATAVSITQNVTVTIPTPSVHTEPPIFTESNITLHCIITLNAAVDTGTAASGVDVTWEGPQGNITSSSRIAISAVTGSSTMYESNLIIYALAMEDLGSYTCRASISPVGGSPYILMSGTGSDSETITVQVPSIVQNLQAVRMSDNSVIISWREPVTTNGIVNYTIEVRQYTNSTGRGLTLVSLDPEVKRSIPVSMFTPVGGVFTHIIAEGLEPFVPYSATVTADNLAGPGDPTDQDFFTRQREPLIPPRNVTVDRLNGTAMNVSWVPLNLVEARGFVQSYFITYEPTSSANVRKRQIQTLVVDGNASYAIASDLQPGISYDVRVSAVTVRVGPVSMVHLPPESAPPPDPTTSEASGAVVGGIIGVLVVALLVTILMVILVNIVYSSRRKGSMSLKATEVAEKPKKPKPKESSSIQLLRFNTKEEIYFKPKTAIRNSKTQVTEHMNPISVTSFQDHVQKMHSENNKGFDLEYQSFEAHLGAPHDAASQTYNKPKNRFANILPYDSSRVKLNEIGGEGSDYINACYMDGYSREKAYIASQGPLPNTVADFWRMIWEKRLPIVVMLTNCNEAGRVKCEKYWGDNVGSNFETSDNRLTITTTAMMSFAEYEIRMFTVKSVENPDAEPLSVTQYHFTSWPDHGVPRYPTSLIAFIRRVQRGHNKDDGYPLLVHCSAGVGRTGTFILLDSMLERMKVEDSVNVYEFLRNMRTQRFMMVQTLPQYIFVHDTLDELITCKETSIRAANLMIQIDQFNKTVPDKDITGFAEQFQLLEEVSRQPVKGDFDDAQEYYNRDKNRYQDKLPYSMPRVHLRPTGEDGSDYINASLVDGYKLRNSYIATQAPLQSTLNDFWRMIWEFKSKSIVMLCKMVEDNRETCYPYWPTMEGETVKYGKVVVTMQSTAGYDDFSVRKFNVQEDKGEGPLVAGFQVTQFHYIEWPEHGKMAATAGVIEMIDVLTKAQISTGNRPITVMCNDGVGRTGTFICIHSQLERLKAEGEVDIFQSIKSARIQRAGLVLEEDQYVYCHEVLADYVDKFKNYANFE